MQQRYFFFKKTALSLRQVWLRNAVWLAAALLLWIAGQFAYFTERVYSRGIYIKIAHFQRIITNLLPFSLGDILYTWVAFLVLVTLVKTVWALVRKQYSWAYLGLRSSIQFGRLVRVYVAFYLLWGLNYSRLGIAWQLQLEEKPYTTAELQQLTTTLLAKVNANRRQMGANVYPTSSPDSIFEATGLAYELANNRFPFLDYRHPSIKPSLYSNFLTYLGYTGYYNPFSGEAQVNTRVPAFYLPYISCHEVAHQLGYGDESEANFVGYLAASASGDPFFRYSAYVDLFSYANDELYLRDTALARRNYQALDTLIKTDLRQARAFFAQYRSRAKPLIRFLYGQYLKANHQPRGIATYEAVTGWLIAYQRKYGEL